MTARVSVMQIIYVLSVATFSLFTRTLICIHIALTVGQKWIRSVKSNGILGKAKSVKTKKWINAR